MGGLSLEKWDTLSEIRVRGWGFDALPSARACIAAHPIACTCGCAAVLFHQSIYQVVLQKSIPAQIRQLILDYY